MIIIAINNKTYASIVNHDKLLGSNTFIADSFDSMINLQYSLSSDYKCSSSLLTQTLFVLNHKTKRYDVINTTIITFVS